MPVYRFVHAFDLVTTVPLEEMEYRHVGDILHIEGGDADQVTRQPQHSLVAALSCGLSEECARGIEADCSAPKVFSA